MLFGFLSTCCDRQVCENVSPSSRPHLSASLGNCAKQGKQCSGLCLEDFYTPVSLLYQNGKADLSLSCPCLAQSGIRAVCGTKLVRDFPLLQRRALYHIGVPFYRAFLRVQKGNIFLHQVDTILLHPLSLRGTSVLGVTLEKQRRASFLFQTCLH